MTPQDREKFDALTLRQTRLEEALLQLRTEFKELEQRAVSPEETEYVPGMPALPVMAVMAATPPPAMPLPPIPVIEEPVTPSFVPALVTTPEPIVPEFSPVVEEVSAKEETETVSPQAASIPLPEIPALATAEVSPDKSGGFEFQFGRWLARIGIFLVLVTLITGSMLAYQNFHHLIGPWTKLSVLTLVSVGLIVAGLRFERKSPEMLVYGRTMAGGGLACLYYTLYGATYVAPLQVIHSQLLGGVLLLAWSCYVVYLAEKKKSELLSVFAIALAYFSSAITPVGNFTMGANLLLSVTAVFFLVRNAWTGLSYLCLLGTYFGLLQQFISYDAASNSWFDFASDVTFGPSATYLIGAWVIYTAGVFLAKSPSFAAGKRMAFLCLNNGALIGLLIVAANLSGFGHVGAVLGFTGGAFLATAYLAKSMRTDAGDVTDAYLMQGLALATGGMVIAYTGVTRGLLITVESVFLAAAGAYSRNIIMRIGGYLSALLGVVFLLVEIVFEPAHPWVMIFGGAATMLANAWLARRDFWSEPLAQGRERFVASAAYYVLLALGLLATGICVTAELAWIAPGLAITTLVLIGSIYLVSLFELPPLAQGLLFLAQLISAAPASQGMSMGSYVQPLWSELTVGAVTMLLVTWWPRQKRVRTEPWLSPVMVLYALGMVALCAGIVHPRVDDQGWMISTSVLSLGFLFYGFFTRTWSFAATGQIFLGLSIGAYFFSMDGTFPWTWWAAAVPIATTFFTAWFVQARLRKATDLPDESQAGVILRAAIFAYQGLTVALIVRMVYGLVPAPQIPLTFYALGAVLMAWNLKWPSSMGLRCAVALDIFGSFAYFSQIMPAPANGATWFNAIGMALLLAQPALLRRGGTALISRWEIFGLTLLANISVSIFVYWAIHPRVDEQGWIMVACLVSLIYLAYGVLARTWQFIASGQAYLALSIWSFLVPPDGSNFPWTWWAAAVPPATVFLTGWLATRWLPQVLQISETARGEVRIAGMIYQAISLGLVTRWIFGVLPGDMATLAFFALATGLLVWNVYRPNSFGTRAALLMNFFGIWNYLSYDHGFTTLTSAAFLLFLAQPAILRRWGRALVSDAESWLLILLSSGMGWFFVSHSVELLKSHNLTLTWAIFALVLTLIGFASNERRQRWCGLAILAAAIVRGGIYDFWRLPDLYKVLTFFALAVICLGLSFLYYKFADRLKKWL